MWRRSKRYNSIFVCALVIVILSLACFFGARDIASGSQVNTEVNTEQTEVATPQGKQKKYFSTFSSAMRYATNDLAKSAGYKSTYVGTITGGLANIFEFSQSISGSKIINNETDESRLQVTTLKHISYGTNATNLYYIFGDTIMSKKGDYSTGDLVVPQEYSTDKLSNFIDYWQIDPVSLPLTYKLSDCISGKKVDTGNGYVLTFTADCLELCSSVLAYCIKWINPENVGKLNPVPNDLIVKITLDAFGQLKTINSKVSYSCDLNGIGIPVTVTGNFSVTETFKEIGVAQHIQKF